MRSEVGCEAVAGIGVWYLGICADEDRCLNVGRDARLRQDGRMGPQQREPGDQAYSQKSPESCRYGRRGLFH